MNWNSCITCSTSSSSFPRRATSTPPLEPTPFLTHLFVVRAQHADDTTERCTDWRNKQLGIVVRRKPPTSCLRIRCPPCLFSPFFLCFVFFCLVLHSVHHVRTAHNKQKNRLDKELARSRRHGQGHAIPRATQQQLCRVPCRASINAQPLPHPPHALVLFCGTSATNSAAPFTPPTAQKSDSDDASEGDENRRGTPSACSSRARAASPSLV